MLQKLLLKTVKELDKSKIPYIVIGGQAVNIYGIVRATQDIDITLGIDITQIDELKKIIDKLKLKYVKDNPDEFAKQFWIMPVYDLKSKIKIDFAFSFSPFEKAAISRAVVKKINNKQVRFCSLEDLIVFKIIAGRPLDLYDVRNILLLNINLDKKYIFKWLKMFEQTTGENYIERLEKITASIK
ncbi:MAG: nucleotidyltransferase [Bacteroidota bacterium]|nr:nucleotidyltransferase [Bacteroidota bacterium]